MDSDFEFPKPNSMAYFEAIKWYTSMIPLIPTIKIDEASWEYEKKIPVAEFRAHWNMKSRLRLAAAQAMFDQNLVDEFFERFPLPSANEYLGAAFAITQSKSALKYALANLLQVSEIEKRNLTPTFFVHVGDGLYRQAGS